MPTETLEGALADPSAPVVAAAVQTASVSESLPPGIILSKGKRVITAKVTWTMKSTREPDNFKFDVPSHGCLEDAQAVAVKFCNDVANMRVRLECESSKDLISQCKDGGAAAGGTGSRALPSPLPRPTSLSGCRGRVGGDPSDVPYSPWPRGRSVSNNLRKSYCHADRLGDLGRQNAEQRSLGSSVDQPHGC